MSLFSLLALPLPLLLVTHSGSRNMAWVAVTGGEERTGGPADGLVSAQRSGAAPCCVFTADFSTTAHGQLQAELVGRPFYL